MHKLSFLLALLVLALAGCATHKITVELPPVETQE